MDGSVSAAYDLSSASLLSGDSVSSKSRAHASSVSLGDILAAASDHNSAILRVCCGTGIEAPAVPACLRRDLSRSAVVLREPDIALLVGPFSLWHTVTPAIRWRSL